MRELLSFQQMTAKAKKYAHEHLMCVVNTELKRRPERFNGSNVSILDLGCGNGDLILLLTENLPQLNPDFNFKIYGYDINEHGGIKKDYLKNLILNLTNKFPQVNWSDHIKLISENDPIPFPSQFFDIIISNQVMEHVKDHPALFSELNRTLKHNGLSAHLFPFKDIIIDPHINLPFIHKIINLDRRKNIIRLFSKLGLGKFHVYRKKYGYNLEEFTQEFSDYFNRLVHYINHKEILEISRNHNFRLSYRYTANLLSNFFWGRGKKNLTYEYGFSDSPVKGLLYMSLFKYFFSITLLLDKEDPI